MLQGFEIRGSTICIVRHVERKRERERKKQTGRDWRERKKAGSMHTHVESGPCCNIAK